MPLLVAETARIASELSRKKHWNFEVRSTLHSDRSFDHCDTLIIPVMFSRSSQRATQVYKPAKPFSEASANRLLLSGYAAKQSITMPYQPFDGG